MLNLAPLFDSLGPPSVPHTERNTFSALPIPGYERHRLGKDVSGAPCLLVAIEGTPTQMVPVPVVLENLTVHYELNCLVLQESNVFEEGCFTVIRCTSQEAAIHSHFLTVATPLILSIGTSPSRQRLMELIHGLIELFRALTQAPRKSVQGLWGELFLIARASNPQLLVSAWHVLPQDRYDFSAGVSRLEVKSALGRVRQHYFSLEQVYPPAGTTLIVASLFLERAGAGVSLEELISRVRARVSDKPELVAHVDVITCLTLGNSWQRALGEKFDHELAEESLAFYEAHDIPKPLAELPPGVTEVRFRADLTGRPSVGLSGLSKQSALFRAFLPA